MRYCQKGHETETPSNYYHCKLRMIQEVFVQTETETIMEIMNRAPKYWSVLIGTSRINTLVELQYYIKYHEDSLIVPWFLSPLWWAMVHKQDALPLHAQLESPIISPRSQWIKHILALDDAMTTMPLSQFLPPQSQSLSYAFHVHPVQPLMFPTTPGDSLFCIHPCSPHQCDNTSKLLIEQQLQLGSGLSPELQCARMCPLGNPLIFPSWPSHVHRSHQWQCFFSGCWKQTGTSCTT